MNPCARAALLLAVAALAACGGDGGASARPQPGDLLVSITTPNADDRALVLTLSGPEAPTAVQAAQASYVVHSRASGTLTRVAVFGALASGPLLRVTVPDVRRAKEYAATLGEVADVRNQARASTQGYTATVSR